MGKRKLTLSVNYANIPLEYQYLNQYHGMPIPGTGTPLGDRLNLPRSAAKIFFELEITLIYSAKFRFLSSLIL